MPACMAGSERRAYYNSSKAGGGDRGLQENHRSTGVKDHPLPESKGLRDEFAQAFFDQAGKEYGLLI